MVEKYEAVVVGGGFAGLGAAYELAKNGVQTLVLERGDFPGAKNVTGGVLYGQTDNPYNLDDLIPGFEKEAPVERPIHDYMMHCVAGDKVKSLDITPLHLHEHKWSYSLLRGPFDAWFAAKVHKECKKSGGGVLSGIRVRGPIMDGDKVIGIETDELEPIHADCIIAADGATSEMARKAGLRTWMSPDQWFQGCKVVVKVPDAKSVETRFGLAEGSGSAHMFAGDLFGGVRGGGFVYTNKDTLSIGTVFHLDSLAEGKVEPHKLMDRLLLHPMVQNWIGPDAEELEYSAKLIPDGKKMVLKTPYKGRLMAVGDAAGHMQAQGPVIKGLNLGISAGMIAAHAYLQAKKDGDPDRAGAIYGNLLKRSYIRKNVRPGRYVLAKAFAENEYMDSMLGWLAGNALARRSYRKPRGVERVRKMMSNAYLAAANPDIQFGYVTLPTILAEEAGEKMDSAQVWTPRKLEDRIARLSYDTDVGKPHILLRDNAPAASGAAVHTCPVSARGFSGGCYRVETVKTPQGGEVDVVALDTQPCIECGTCAIMAETDWEHPRGGKGVQYVYG